MSLLDALLRPTEAMKLESVYQTPSPTSPISPAIVEPPQNQRPAAPEPTRIIEATFLPANANDPERPINPEFPVCPDCKMARYWIAPSGKVVCGKCGQTRFLLTSIAYHVVN